jgi:hypothetical protein
MLRRLLRRAPPNVVVSYCLAVSMMRVPSPPPAPPPHTHMLSGHPAVRPRPPAECQRDDRPTRTPPRPRPGTGPGPGPGLQQEHVQH